MACSLPSYDVSKVPRGYGIIVVNKFENVPVLKRKGADQEIVNLENLYKSLGLKTCVYKDLTKQKIETMLDMTSKCRDLEEHSMIAIAFSSHGGEKGLYGADCDPNDPNIEKFALSPNDIKSYFTSDNCPFLEGKPKLFFLNGCRGDQKEEAHFVESQTDGEGATNNIDESDFLTLHSTVSGHVAMRDTEAGSLFINVLCEVLLKYHGYEISQLIPVVNGELMKRAKRPEDIDGIQVVLTETCVAEQNLTKKLILTQVPIIQESTAGTQ